MEVTELDSQVCGHACKPNLEGIIITTLSKQLLRWHQIYYLTFSEAISVF